MEALVTKLPRSDLRRHRYHAFAHGARSAFDLTGLRALRDEAFRPRSLKPVDPAAMIARDMTRVMYGFGRSAACARRAVEAGLKVENLKPGCTANEDFAEEGEVPLRDIRRSRGIALNSVD